MIVSQKPCWVLGVDFGTDSVRVLAVNPADGTVGAEAVSAYPRWTQGLYCDPARGLYRQHPQDYLDAFETCVREVAGALPDPDAVAGIGFDTTASTPVLIDREGVPLALRDAYAACPDAMFVLWKDHTALAEADRINAVVAGWETDFTRFSGGSYSCEWVWAKMLHVLRATPSLQRDAVSWVEHCDWMPALLTGQTRPETLVRSRCAAGHKALWHARWGGLPGWDFWDAVDPVLGLFKGHLYEQTRTADRPVGRLTPQWAARLGLRPGIVVGGGAIDCHVGAVGAGIVPGLLVKVVGTSTCDIAVGSYADLGERPVRGICGQVDGSVLPGMVGVEAGQSAFGDVYAWLRRLLAWRRSDDDRTDLLAALNQEAAALVPALSDPVALDWFNGRRTPDPDARVQARLAGLDLGLTPPALFKTLVEATAFGSRAILERLRSEGIRIDEVVAVGGIALKSPYVMQTLSDVLDVPIRVLHQRQCCALGAAVLASVAAGIHPDVSAAQAAMTCCPVTPYLPSEARRAVYDGLYARYRQLAAEEDASRSRN